MKKIGLIVKETAENRIKDTLKSANAVLVIKYSGVSGPALSSLRKGLKGANASLFITKNCVARRALGSAKMDSLLGAIEGPCGLVFVKEEPVATSKVLCNFLKEHEQLKLEGGLLKDKILEFKDIEAMAKLPSLEVLRAQLVMTLNAPISGLAICLNQILAKFVYCLDQIREKKNIQKEG